MRVGPEAEGHAVVDEVVVPRDVLGSGLGLRLVRVRVRVSVRVRVRVMVS